MYKMFQAGLYTLSAFGFLALASCSNTTSEEPKIEQAKATNVAPLSLQAEIQLDESARSLIYTLDQNGGFQYKLNDGYVKVFTALRTKDSSKPMYFGAINWKVDAKNNKLVLDQYLVIDASLDLYRAMEDGEWYVSCAFSNVLTTYDYREDGNRALQSHDSPSSTQKFVIKPLDEYQYIHGRSTRVQPVIKAMPENVPGYSMDILDFTGTINKGTQVTKLPALYIMPWTKVSITGGKYVSSGEGSRAISFVDGNFDNSSKTVSFSGVMKPIGTIVRAKIQTAPATYEMLDKSPNIEDIKDYVDGAQWRPGQLNIYAKSEGQYDFSGELVEGQVPKFTPIRDTELTLVHRQRSQTLNTVGFNDGIKDYGYLYFWTPENTFSASYKIEHTYDGTSYFSYVRLKPGFAVRNEFSVNNNDPRPFMATVDRDMEYATRMRVSTPGITETKIPVYPSSTKTPEADAIWKRRFNMSPYAFDVDLEYPRKTITGLKGGYTKEITIRVKPHIKNARRVTLEQYQESGSR